jgi:hypothetical protein
MITKLFESLRNRQQVLESKSKIAGEMDLSMRKFKWDERKQEIDLVINTVHELRGDAQINIYVGILQMESTIFTFGHIDREILYTQIYEHLASVWNTISEDPIPLNVEEALSIWLEKGFFFIVQEHKVNLYD